MAEGRMVNLKNVLAQWLDIIIKEVRAEIEKDDIVASGRLLASFGQGDAVKIFGSAFTIELHMEDYGKDVDEGTKPGRKPDVQKIYRWMQHKGIQPQASKASLTKPHSAKARKVFKDRRLVLAERIANAIERRGTIKRFGYKGSGFVTDYTKTLEERMAESIYEATGKDIEIQIIKDIQ